jgi:hypothetical protein
MLVNHTYGDLNLVQLTNMYTEHTAMRYCLWLLIVQVNDESVYFMKLCRRYTFIASTKIIFGEIKIIFHPSEASRVFSPELSFFDRKRQRHWQRITCRRPLQFVVCVVFECYCHEILFMTLNCAGKWRIRIFYEVMPSLYIYCMLVREIWKCIHPKVSYSLRATPEGNMILVGEYIFIFPEPACYECSYSVK